MNNTLLTLGSFPERALPTIVSAFSCGAVNPVSELNIFHLSAQDAVVSAGALINSLSRCHDIVSVPGENLPAFPARFSFDSCEVILPSQVDFADDPDSVALLSALRGKNLPLSFKKDREVIEWAFACLLNDRPNNSCDPFFAWIDDLRALLVSGASVRLALLCDPADPFSAGLLFALLPWLRSSLPGDLALSVFALAETTFPVDESFYPSLDRFLQDLSSRSLVRSSSESAPSGADAIWLIAMPPTILSGADSHGIAFFAAARALSAFYAPDQPVPFGLHTCETSGSVSLASLGFRAVHVAAFIEFACWLLSDVLPTLHSYLAHPSRIRALPNSRNGLFRSLFGSFPDPKQLESLDVLEQTLKSLLKQLTSFLQSVPAALRYSDEAQQLWQKATDACGRYITVASEIDVTRTEIRESGLEGVRPVHRESMEDTEEEHLQQKLEQMSLQLEEETKMRNDALSAVGPFRAMQARRDCCLKCRTALEAAEKKIAALSPETTEHITFALQERRIRLLRSAVAQSEADLRVTILPEERPETAPDAAAPQVILSDEASSAIRKITTDKINSEKVSESSDRELRDRLPILLRDVILPDSKDLQKLLVSRPRPLSSGNPVTDLLRLCWDVCASVTAAKQFLPQGDWPAATLLPDIMPATPLTSIPDLLELMPPEAYDPARETSEARGLLAMLFLAHYKRRLSDEPKLVVDNLRNDATLPRCWLSGFHDTGIQIFSLANEDAKLPFAVVIPGRLFLPAFRTPAHRDLIPPFATWYRRDSATFDDPCLSLSEGDRALLVSRLSDMISAWPEENDSPLKSFLSSFLSALKQESDEEDLKFSVRVKAVCALQQLPAYQDDLKRITRFYEHFLGVDPVAAGLTGIRNFRSAPCDDMPGEVLYTWRGIPFARENARRILESTFAPGEDEALETMESECRTLSGISDDYRDALAKEAAALLSRFPEALEANKDIVTRILNKAEKPFSDHTPELVWPWNPASPSIHTILSECLGETLGSEAADPFSEQLAVFPARGQDAIGDSYFGVMCSVLPFGTGATPIPDSPISPDAVLPPLSPSLVAAICTTSEGRALLKPDFIHLDHPDDHSFRVTLTLNGAFTLRLRRTYTEEETLFLYAHDLPTLALWPSVPFRPEHWHTYYVYAHLPELFSLSVLPSGSSVPVPVEDADRRCSAAFRQFPVAFLFARDGKTVGALPNLLPEPEITPVGHVTACIDFGSVGTSVVLSSGETRKPLQGPTMVRILLNNPASTQENLRREFLPAVPVSALLPTASRLFRETAGVSPVPFVDGIVFMSQGIQDVVPVPADSLHTCLKRDDKSDFTDMLCLHQVMLITALQARVDGARNLSWRFAVPDEMKATGREGLHTLFNRLVVQVSEESGFNSLLEPVPNALFASESAALGAYFRLCAWEDTRGGFMVLDLGAVTADISLFLRGKPLAARSCQIPLGVHHMLLPALLQDPPMLYREFGSWPDPAFQADLNLLGRLLEEAKNDPTAIQKARLALDHFLADHYANLISALQQLGAVGYTSRFGAILLLHLSYLTMLTGLVLLQIAADPTKNDFLPEQMSLCLAGRGALLLESLPDALKKELWRFLTMFRNKRVASMSLLFSAEKKMEIPVGLSVLQELTPDLPPSSAAPASISVRPEELLPEFLLRFCRVFPREAQLLFPNFFTGDYYHPFTPQGEAILTEAIDASFTPTETPRPYDSLAAWINTLLANLPQPPM